jgi:hypothetical protein
MYYSVNPYDRNIEAGWVTDLGKVLWASLSIEKDIPEDMTIKPSAEDITRTQKNIDKAKKDLIKYEALSIEVWVVGSAPTTSGFRRQRSSS